jgi:formiminotetrahydrofolate cyclodeaminase
LVVSELALRAFSRKLGSADPTPGGGSASAAAGAMAAGLVRMVAQLTACSPKYEEFALRATSIADRAEHVMETLLQSVDEDAAAFDEVAAAFKLPRSNDAEKSARTAAIQAALLGAAEPPLRVIGASLEACRLAA